MASRAKRRSAARRLEERTHSPSTWRRGKWWFMGACVASAIALLVALVVTLSGGETSSGSAGSLAAEPAPDITLATLAGDFTLSENLGQVHLLYFSFPG